MKFRGSRGGQSAVHFDEGERAAFLRSFIGAKKRRREFHEQRVKEQAK
jgi:hypothetical protein